MKICHVITRMIVGGAQENTLLSCRGAIEAGHDVTLLTGPTEGPEGKLLQNEKCPGLKVELSPHLIRELSPKEDWLCYRDLVRYFRKEKFDVVHTHASKAGILGRLAAARAGVPFVVHTIHGLAYHPYQKPWKNRIYILAERIAARCCQRIYSVADAMTRQSLAAGVGRPEQYKTVYSGMELETFLAAPEAPSRRAELGIPSDAFVFATCARLFPEKGYEDFIPAALKTASLRKNAFFLIIGNGILADSIRKRVNESGLGDRFLFAGLVPPKQVPGMLAQSDALVHLSLHEGLPRAAVQELAEGKPVIGYDLDGTPEVVLDGKTGFLIHPRNVEDVTDRMIRLLDDRELARTLGAGGRKLVQERFGWRTMSDALLKDYEEASFRNRGSSPNR